MPCLGSGLSPRWPEFDPNSVHVRFVVNKVALERDFSSYFDVSVSILFHSSPMLVFIYTLLLPEGQRGTACKPCKTNKSSYRITGLDRPLGLQEVEAPRFVDNRHINVLSLSALRPGRLYPPRNIPNTHFCCGSG